MLRGQHNKKFQNNATIYINLKIITINMLKDSDIFFKIYSNLPIAIRKEIILVIEKQPITWNVAATEIANNTKLGEEILKKLTELKFI